MTEGLVANASPLIRPMRIDDYDAVIALMQATPGVTVRDADSREMTQRYLARNPGLSFVAVAGGVVVGCLMAGHDGRRGYLQHLVVVSAFRRRGIAAALVEQCVSALAQEGIRKSHIDILKTNDSGKAFWERQGWVRRTDIDRYSYIRGGGDNT